MTFRTLSRSHCPFCGNQLKIVVVSPDEAWVECETQGCVADTSFAYGSEWGNVEAELLLPAMENFIEERGAVSR